MDINTFENIKKKIEVLKSKKAKAEGAIEAIQEQWKTQYEITTLKEAEKKLTEMEEEQSKLEHRVNDLFTELNNLTNWNLV